MIRGSGFARLILLSMSIPRDYAYIANSQLWKLPIQGVSRVAGSNTFSLGHRGGCISGLRGLCFGFGSTSAQAMHTSYIQGVRGPIWGGPRSTQSRGRCNIQGNALMGGGRMMMSTVDKAYDEEQLRLLDADSCILVNERDEVLGSASKKFCHLMSNIDDGKALHRAFSIFLFNSKGELLLQKRSSDKILFPLRWTNTCCSHPLHIADELDNPPCPQANGVRRAAVRKLEHELGISIGQVPADSLHYMTRIVYKAAVGEDDKWGEHEVDYILIGTADTTTNINLNEVCEVKYIARGELEGLLAAEDRGEVMLSPWFRLIAQRWLPIWWDALLQGKLHTTMDSEKIHIIS